MHRTESKRKCFTVEILADRCKGCMLCVKVCPKDVFADEGRLAEGYIHQVSVRNEAACIGCKACTLICPDTAICVLEKKR